MSGDRLRQLHKEVAKVADKEKGVFLQRFFKTGKGEYGEGDIFVGLTVPQSRLIARKYKDISLPDIRKLLQSKIHEERLIALLILVSKFQTKDDKERKEIFDFYLANTKQINNWDLVDLSADKIVGEYLYARCHAEPSRGRFNYSNSKDKSFNSASKKKGIPNRVRDDKKECDITLLKKLARSDYLWERRIAMVSTYQFIKNGRSKEAIVIASILLPDRHDLIQKAVGWMLRELGKRASKDVLVLFLNKYRNQMGRTSLRYAIEHFPEKERKAFLSR